MGDTIHQGPFGRFRPIVALGVFGLVWGLLAAVTPIDSQTESRYGVVGALGILIFLALLIERATEAALVFSFKIKEEMARHARRQAGESFGDIANTVQKLAEVDFEMSAGDPAGTFGKAASEQLEKMAACDQRVSALKVRKLRVAVSISLFLALCLTVAGFRVLYPVSACCVDGPSAWIDMGFTVLVLVGLAEGWHKVLNVPRS